MYCVSARSCRPQSSSLLGRVDGNMVLLGWKQLAKVRFTMHSGLLTAVPFETNIIQVFIQIL